MSDPTKPVVRGGPRPPGATQPNEGHPNDRGGPRLPPGVEPREPQVFDQPVDFEAREGDVLVVGYPEVTIPLKQYASAKVGGLIYTRRLKEGESVAEQFEKIYSFLSRRAEADAREKVKRWATELKQ